MEKMTMRKYIENHNGKRSYYHYGGELLLIKKVTIHPQFPQCYNIILMHNYWGPREHICLGFESIEVEV